MLRGITLFITLIIGLTPAFAVDVPSAPDIDARGYILQDAHSGDILAELNADQRLEPASLTKVMTGYVAFRELASGNISLSDQVTVSEKAWRTGGSKMFIKVDTQVSVEHLLQGIIIQSGNDASIALAEYIAGSEDAFAQLMNSHAQRLGMTNSNFLNSSGLPDKDHYTTARDMAIVTRALINEFPEYYKWYSVREFTYNDIVQYNRNKLLRRDSTVDGVKTGHTESAGYCLISSALRKDQRMISVVMGTDSPEARAKASQSLLNFGFRFFETHKLYAAGEALTNARVWKGAQESVALGLEQDLYITIPRNRYSELKAGMVVNKRIMAPVKADRDYGEVQVTLAGEELLKVALIALESVNEGDIWQRLADEARLLFE